MSSSVFCSGSAQVFPWKCGTHLRPSQKVCHLHRQKQLIEKHKKQLALHLKKMQCGYQYLFFLSYRKAVRNVSLSKGDGYSIGILILLVTEGPVNCTGLCWRTDEEDNAILRMTEHRVLRRGRKIEIDFLKEIRRS